MKYSEAEIAFLIRPHKVETADMRERALRQAVDLRQLGCPAAIFEKVLESRARKLGSKFIEFRNQQTILAGTSASDLDSLVAGNRLF